jgi:hypothetical protein
MPHDRAERLRAALQHAVRVAAEDDVPCGTLLHEVVGLAAAVTAHLPVDARLVAAVLQAQAEGSRRQAGLQLRTGVMLAWWLLPDDEL